MEWRKCQVFKNDEWVDSDLSLVKKGDTFRLFEDDETPVKDKQGRTEWLALKDAVPCEPEGNHSVEVVSWEVVPDEMSKV
jgi:hypothetical protein